MYAVLDSVIVLGMSNTVAGSQPSFGGEYDYREGVSLWFGRGTDSQAPQRGWDRPTLTKE
ncbi:MAG: hypothetical protein ABI131_01245 [Nostocoides sp.]